MEDRDMARAWLADGNSGRPGTTEKADRAAGRESRPVGQLR